ncbi:MAG: prepilin-type N-terminal cleavage/methylation domain-containing protein [Victivallales bacterium]|nr:prepilin-type N-terminal cleavage/methylation domain-containing protein [Victivallales bacterium]MCF7888765.1 prepilin-type N-terminal cleavage/methylation domain-containing protein [Victivallales bacterium]
MELKKCSYFTLLELLVAMTVIAICFTVILNAVALNIKNTAIAEGYTTAGFLAKVKMAKLMNKNKFEVGEKKGNFGDDYPEYRWNIKIKNFNDKQSAASEFFDISSLEDYSTNNIANDKNKEKLKSILLTVSFIKANQKRSIKIKTLVTENTKKKKENKLK